METIETTPTENSSLTETKEKASPKPETYGAWRPQRYTAVRAPHSKKVNLRISVGLAINALGLNEKSFRNGVHYRFVYRGLHELLSRLNLLHTFRDWMNDPLSMIAHCSCEHAQRNEREASLESLFSLSKSL